jgi:hypothetical protein
MASGILYTWYVMVQGSMHLYELVHTLLAALWYNLKMLFVLPPVIPMSVHAGTY